MTMWKTYKYSCIFFGEIVEEAGFPNGLSLDEPSYGDAKATLVDPVNLLHIINNNLDDGTLLDHPAEKENLMNLLREIMNQHPKTLIDLEP